MSLFGCSLKIVATTIYKHHCYWFTCDCTCKCRSTRGGWKY